MRINVNKDKVEILENQNEAHEGEYLITKCYFTFDDFINEFQVKRAIFTIISTGEMVETDIINNECDIPSEVLKHEFEKVKLGVYAYDIDENEKLARRASPSYATFTVPTGSYEEGAETPEPITPTQYDVYSAKLQEGLDEVDDKIAEMDIAIAGVENLDVDAEKVDTTTTVTITKKDGTQKEVEVLDGVSLENMEIQNRDLLVTYGGNTNDLGQIEPNVQVGTTTTIAPSLNARVENVGTTLNPVFNFYIPKGEAGSIKFDIVEQLPTEDIELDTIYLVPYAKVTVQELPTENIQANTIYIVSGTGKRYIYQSNQWIEIASDNQYLEYIYVNNQWEELGSIGVDIDLTDYYTKSETNSLLSSKVGFTDYATYNEAGVVKKGAYSFNLTDSGYPYANVVTYENYLTSGNTDFIGKGTLENVITGKGLVSNTDYASPSNYGVVKLSRPQGLSGITVTNGAIEINGGSTTLINNRNDGNPNNKTYRSIALTYPFIDYALKKSITTNTETLTSEEKGLATTWLGAENSTNKVTSLSSSSTDTQYPSAKCVYDLVGDVESILETLDIGTGV